MHPLLIILHLAAAVMLLLWAVRMVRTGMERSYGSQLREALRQSRGGSVGLAGAGMVMAILLQSATAVGVLAAGFAATGILTPASGLAALLGADLGSALVARLLAFDLSELIPALILIGAVLFLKFENRQVRQHGRILLGIAFILLSLRMIGEATEPMRESAVLPGIMAYFERDPLTACVVAAVLTWAMHSSVAMVLLLASLAQASVLSFDAALPMLVGTNIGSGMIAAWLTRGMAPVARRIPVGNLIFRAGCGLAALALLSLTALPLDWLAERTDFRVVNAHVLFNLCLLVLALPLIGPMERLTALLLPEPVAVEPVLPADTRPQSALDRSKLGQPSLALASAKRELLLMGETVEQMFAPIMDMMASRDPARKALLLHLEAELNRRHSDIKLFIAELNRGQLSADEARRGIDLTDFSINLEHAGDIMVKTLLPLTEDKHRQNLRFSDEGWAEMRRLHDRVAANLQMALNVLVSGDAASAYQLMREKETLRALERDSHDRHLGRLQLGNAASLATSNLHLEVVRAFKEINSLIVTVAHPILAEQGLIRESRLAAEPAS